MKRKIVVYNHTLWIDSRLAKEYEKFRMEITGIHAESLLLTEHITKDMSVSTKWLMVFVVCRVHFVLITTQKE